MKKIGVFYGSSTGNTGDVAKVIQQQLGNDNADVFDVSEVEADELDTYKNIVFGTSTWGAGDIQDDFDEFLDKLDSVDLSGKKIALFGLGDQISHGDTFIDGLAEVYKKVNERGASVIGKTSTDGYEHEASESEIDGKFVGLALDEDNQSELTDDRVSDWVGVLKGEFV